MNGLNNRPFRHPVSKPRILPDFQAAMRMNHDRRCQEDEAALYHPGNAVVKPLTVGLNPWEAHELGGYDNTTNEKCVIINRVELAIVSTFSTCPSSPVL